MGSIFGVFGASKKEAKFEMIFERIFWDRGGSAGNAEPVGGLKGLLAWPLGYGIW